ncbi:MAG: hypothetical protein ACOC2H_05860 [Spirochaetota bacterium]
MAKAMSLIKAYQTNQLPMDGGFIISSFFTSTSIYTIYEITAFKNVKDIFYSPSGLTFKTDGNRCHILVEPPTYAKNFEEPVNREEGRSIPYRFDECHLHKGQRQEKIYIAKEPIMLYSSFTILTQGEDNFSFIFYPTRDVYIAIKRFMADSLYNDCGLRKTDSRTISELLIETLKKFNIWQA